MRFTLPLMFAFMATAAHADPTVFGLTLGKTTQQQFLDQYPAKEIGESLYSGGPIYDVDPANIDFDGLQKVRVIFDDKGTLAYVTAQFPKEKFDYLNQALGKKYKLVSKQVPFVGNKKATYKDGNSKIFLEAPHMSFEMDMTYLTNAFDKAFTDARRETNKQKKSKEESQL